jgi:ssDNA-specific exonuclease RecJ
MSEIDGVLVALLDGSWHDLSEIAHTLQIDYEELVKIVELLAEFTFIQIKDRRICIDFDTKKLLESINHDSEKK